MDLRCFMSDRKQIVDNESPAKILQALSEIEDIKKLFPFFPELQQAFPKLIDNAAALADLKAQAKILFLPDRFNELFADAGWIAYESMSLRVMEEAVAICEKSGLDIAEEYLANSYDEQTLKWGIQWFNGQSDFKKRIRLAELAKEDYLAERYHACIPLLISLLDGLTNDVSNHVGFFAEKIDLVAYDSIAAHESGLQKIRSLMSKGRNKTNEDTITIPYRNGIMHGRELSFDNRVVAAKVWAAIFASRDWACALAEGKKSPTSTPEYSINDFLASHKKHRDLIARVDAWQQEVRPKSSHIPCSGSACELPKGSPERFLAEFIENWMHRRFDAMARALYLNSGGKKEAGEARKDFGGCVVKAFSIVDTEDSNPSCTKVSVQGEFSDEQGDFEESFAVSVVYLDEQGYPFFRLEPGGKWKIIQNSFRSVIYRYHSE